MCKTLKQGLAICEKPKRAISERESFETEIKCRPSMLTLDSLSLYEYDAF